MGREKKRFLGALYIPLVLLLIMWVIQIIQYSFGLNFARFGVHPLHANGLPGIILAPLIHASFKHIGANSIPFLVLGLALFYFYRNISLKVLIFIWLMSGIWVWFGGRDAYHIGVSGVIYGMASFLFVSGTIRRNIPLAALSLVVIFVYGSMIWGIFPGFFPKEHISWEAHMGGLFSGIVMAFYYKKSGPKRKKYSWEIEEEIEELVGEDDDDKDAYWKKPTITFPSDEEEDDF